MNLKWWNKDLIIFSSLSGENRSAVVNNVVIQALFILISSMILDGGTLLRVVLLASLGWWLGLLFILMFHAKFQGKTDLPFLRAGFVLMIVVAFFTEPFWGLLRK